HADADLARLEPGVVWRADARGADARGRQREEREVDVAELHGLAQARLEPRADGVPDRLPVDQHQREREAERDPCAERQRGIADLLHAASLPARGAIEHGTILPQAEP